MVSKLTLYYNEPQIEVVVGTDANSRTHLPMYNREHKIFRGINNSIAVVLKDQDRQEYRVFDRVLKCVVVDPYAQEVKLIRYLDASDENPGVYSLKILAGDTRGWNSGFYHYSIVMENDDGSETPFYTTLDQEISGVFELIDKPYPAIQPSHKINASDFVAVNYNNVSSPFLTTWSSSRYPGAGQKNIVDSCQSFSLNLVNFTGSFFVQASMEGNPTHNNDWFDLAFDSANPQNRFINYTNNTGLYAFDIIGNYVWLRFQYDVSSSNSGSVQRIYLKV